MVDAPLLRRNSGLKSGGATFLATIRFWLCPACYFVAWLAGAPAQAAIIPLGSVFPPYPGGDPWNVGIPLYVGHIGPGTLTINGGSDVSNTDGWLGLASGISGLVNILDTGSSWENTNDLWVGNSFGFGHLTISDNGTVYVGDAAHAGGATGWLTVSDSDDSGTLGGHLRVLTASILTHSGNAIVGDDTGEYGWATVQGPGAF